ncbi:HlyD family type I secretion periplasmic adaptor subunit [Methylobacterium radiodurans]|uniref:Membrane fusion protein (MFP) family protein n=1 Tax=Methylobacterium radiodurans TaxID=2202828 RepID=A0A2U8VLV5_9HYPH|nr:HlyD family type I secretion periplasmic adaptor subunit [Methylobacterium radiodurans]AWN34421.1 HlyD family type I secretion periplasmic adaptor subunit [Methylobacterium radiodurans]
MNDLVLSRANAIGKAVTVRAGPVTGRIRTYISGSSLLSGRTDDTEFLPAHLEILETPPSPQRVAALWLLCGALAAALVWSCFAKLDIFAIATGRVQVAGRSKVIQPLDPGAVKAIRVENGTQVRAGDILLELDPTVANADKQASSWDIWSLRAEIPRRQAEIKALESGATVPPKIDFPEEIGAEIRLREESVLVAELAQYISAKASLEGQVGENDALKSRLAGSVAARTRLIDVLKERLGMKQELVVRAAGTRAALLESQQALESELTNLAYDKGQMMQAEAAGISLVKKLEQLQKQSVAEQAQKLTDAQRKLDRFKEDLAKASFRVDRMTLRAPISGTVQQLAVTTIGQVVTTGQPLMVIVPSEGNIEIEALVQNTDIGFVEIGQEATIKVNAFPFTRYGTLDGRVVRVSRDAVDAKDASQTSDAATASRAQNSSIFSATPAGQNLVFPVVIALSKTTLLVDGKNLPLTPGMTATVEVQTGSRRVIDYLFAPIRETTSTAGHER